MALDVNVDVLYKDVGITVLRDSSLNLMHKGPRV